ncbi:TetR/AcrR family transcriptional regulator [Lacticaseibacillus suihuaensis]
MSDQLRKKKRAAILQAARGVFSQKGLIGVTMSDLVAASGISRGGLYLYYKSVDEVFTAVVQAKASHRFAGVKAAAARNVPFAVLFNAYLAGHKNRLLHQMNDSMLLAMYEYAFTHKRPADHAFQRAQYATTEETILSILRLGVAQGVLLDVALAPVAEHVMFTIEGMNVLALTSGLTPEQIESQWRLLKAGLPWVAPR